MVCALPGVKSIGCESLDARLATLLPPTGELARHIQITANRAGAGDVEVRSLRRRAVLNVVG